MQYLTELISQSWQMVTFRHTGEQVPNEYSSQHLALLVVAFVVSLLRWSLAGYEGWAISLNFLLHFGLGAWVFGPEALAVMLLASIGVDLSVLPLTALGLHLPSPVLLAWETLTCLIGSYRVWRAQQLAMPH